MGLFDKLRGEFIDIIEWTEPAGSDVLAYRFPRYQNEIKNGARLTVREGQVAVFVSEGQIADGNPNEVQKVVDLWTFRRDTKSSDPNWLLVKTESEG